MPARLLWLGPALLLTTQLALADPVPPDPAGAPAAALQTAQEPARPDGIVVIGSREAQQTLTGSGQYVDAEDFRLRGYDDINRALRIAPGVYLRDEDGLGLFPNISLRGVDSQRTSKLTLMEDGIPSAPAPYSAPAAYYSPTVGRMTALEVLKGSSQIQFGPQTTGGVINYRSTPIPDGPRAHLEAVYGTDRDLRSHAFFGNAWDTDWGRFGVMGEYFFRDADGFKELDLASDDTGFRKNEQTLKAFWEPPGERYQRIEAKLGFTDLDADETYLGLTDGDFDDDHVRRYAGSRFDNIDTNHTRSYLRWTSALSDRLTLTTTAFYNRFKRNWFKLRGDGADLADPGTLAVWKGETAGTLHYRNNRREYYSAGLDTALDWSTELGSIPNDFRFGVRYMQDRVRRDQNNENYLQDEGGAILGKVDQGDCSGGCRKQNSQALALFIQDDIQLGRLTLQPGLRFERVDQKLRRYTNTGIKQPRQSGNLAVWSPGLGARFDVSDTLRLFGGVHKGAFLPSPNAHLHSGVREETSIAAELGARWSPAEFLGGEVTLFQTDFDDLIVVDNIGSGGTGDDENVGDVVTRGVELSAHFDPGVWQGWGFRNPWQIALTLTDAELDGDAESGDPESLFAGGKDGNDVPYIPRYQLTGRTGIEFERLSFHVDVIWVDETFSTASNASGPVDPEGNLDYGFGRTDDYLLVDLSVRFELTERTALKANVHNLFDEEYIVSRHPIGPRPGRPRAVFFGMEYDWE